MAWNGDLSCEDGRWPFKFMLLPWGESADKKNKKKNWKFKLASRQCRWTVKLLVFGETPGILSDVCTVRERPSRFPFRARFTENSRFLFKNFPKMPAGPSNDPYGALGSNRLWSKSKSMHCILLSLHTSSLCPEPSCHNGMLQGEPSPHQPANKVI